MVKNLNIFQGICFVLAASAFIKVFFGVFFHRQLYAWARKQYSSEKRPFFVNLLLGYALLLLVLSWTGVLANTVPGGWVLAAIITLFSLKSLNVLFNWRATGVRFVSFIDRYEDQLWLVDVLVGALGVIFLSLGIWVY